jgi:hypothetical protein
MRVCPECGYEQSSKDPTYIPNTICPNCDSVFNEHLVECWQTQEQAREKELQVLEQEEQAKKELEAREHAQVRAHGTINSKMICPHCQENGCVHTKAVDKSRAGLNPVGFVLGEMVGGVAGGILGGMTRFERKTQAYCHNCENSWVF